MPDFRCFCECTPSAIGDQINLSPDESNHLVAANRARVGDPVRVFDGKGNEWDTRVTVAHKRHATLAVEAAHSISPPPYHIALAQALPKGKLIESIIRKATEIGIQRVFPLITSRVETKIDPKKTENKNAKWTAATLEGAKQSGNPYLVEIEPVCDLASLLEQTKTIEIKLLASLTPEARSLKTHIQDFRSRNNGKSPFSAIWLVGPEGDFSPAETKLAIEAGYLPTTLGPHVMRSETAAVHALSIIQYELEPIHPETD